MTAVLPAGAARQAPAIRPVTRRAAPPAPVRTARHRRYVMCPPDHFEVRYAINPWMDVRIPVDRALARRQWDALRRTYLDLGHDVLVAEPVAGLPDMVFAANGALVVGDRALGARFAHPERSAEAPAYAATLAAAGIRVTAPVAVNEGEGDLLVVGGTVLAGSGFRSSPDAHREAQQALGLPVVGLELVDPRFYHLDTALAVLSANDVAWYPPAFSPGSRAVLRRLFPDAVVATGADALVLGLNAVSDGRTVVLAGEAVGLAAQLRERGYDTVGVELSELRRAGGGAKCATMELHAAPPRPDAASGTAGCRPSRRGRS